MEFHVKPKAKGKTQTRLSLEAPHQVISALSPVQALQRFVATPVQAQVQAALPVLRASALRRQEEGQLTARRRELERQKRTLNAPSGADDHLPKQSSIQEESASVPLVPHTSADWVAVMRMQAEQIEGRPVGAREAAQFSALQRQVARTLSVNFRQDRQVPEQRYQQYAAHVVDLQRHSLGGQVAQAFLRTVPFQEGPALQRAIADILQRDQSRQAEGEAIERWQSIQRQLAELEQEAARPVFERIQARRGTGNPLPTAVQRHLEQGLNHDLNAVRVHDDTEAHQLAKSVNALAFTTGTDIFFQQGHFNPNTQTGLELLAHETTHVVQQSRGRVGPGIDPDVGLESEAQAMGRRLAVPVRSVPLRQTLKPVGVGRANQLQRLAGPGQDVLRTAADDIAAPKAGVNKVGFVKNTEGANIRSAPAEVTGSRELTVRPLPPGTKVFVSGTHPQKPEWAYVSASLADRIVRGYVQGLRITTNLPEPSATLYFVQKDGETLRPIASRIYHREVQPGRDLRFYEEAVLYLSRQAGLGGAVKEGSVKLRKNEFVWLPSPAFANSLAGKVPSGSITGGAVTQARVVGRRLDDVLASMSQAPQHLPKVGAEYAGAIREHLPQIIGVTAAFMAAEGLSALLAATPTGIGQLAASAIQLGLGVWAAHGAAEALNAALPFARRWLTTAWNANGDPKQVAVASENFLYMAVQIALAALALLGGKGNIGKGMKLAQNVRITPPSLGVGILATPGGQTVAIPIFKPGSITATATATVRPSLGGLGTAGGQVKPGDPPAAVQSEIEQALANKNLTDEQIEALLKKTKNWDELKKYVGMKADKNAAPPPGYYWTTGTQGVNKGKTIIARLPGNKSSGEFAPLTVKDGVVVLRVGGSNRISLFSRYRKNFLDYAAQEAEAQGKSGAVTREAAERLLNLKAEDGRGLYQLHHMVADNVAQTSPLVRAALRYVKGYTVDRGSNMFALPRRLRPGEPYIHEGAHPYFDQWVTGKLKTEELILTRNGTRPLTEDMADLIDDALRRVEDEVRVDIKTKNLPKKVLEELESGGLRLTMNDAVPTEAMA